VLLLVITGLGIATTHRSADTSGKTAVDPNRSDVALYKTIIGEMQKWSFLLRDRNS
jgi:hypothetical protein